MSMQPPHRTLRSWVYETLRDRIIKCDYLPGSSLVEAHLAQEIGVSRSPIREAFRQLGQEGLVITAPNAATTVTTMDEFDIDQIFEMRDLFESCLIAHTAVNRPPPGMAECRSLLERMPAIAAAADIPGYAEVDVRFHEVLWDMAGRPRLVATLTPIAYQARRYLNLCSRTLGTESAESLLASYAEHVQIFDAVEAGDVQAAVTATRNHMQTSRSRIMQGLWQSEEERQPDGHLGTSRPLAFTVSWTEGSS